MRAAPGSPRWLGSLASPVHACAGLRSAGLARVHRRICSSSSSSSQPPAPPGSSEPRRTGFPQRTVCSRQPLRSAHTRRDPTQVSTPTPPPPSSPWASVQRQPLPTAILPLGAHWPEPKGNPHRTEERCCVPLCPSNGCETVQEAHLQSLLEATSPRSSVLLIAGGPALLVRE